MQNLFVKFLVLGSVIGSSCFVVWQAHDGLQSVAKKVDPGEFMALSEQPTAEQDQLADSALEWDSPLKLAEPTTAVTPAQSEKSASASERQESQAIDSLTSAPPAQKQELDDSEFPLFFHKEGRAQADAKQMPPLQTEPELPNASTSHEPLPTPRKNKADFASQEFVDLPGQQIEQVSHEEATSNSLKTPPQAEPLPTLATARLPNQAESAEPVEEPVAAASSRFGPSEPVPTPARALPEKILPEKTLPETSVAMEAHERSREMPGLTRLPPSHPGPVLLPAEDFPSAGSESAHRSAVITADAVESDLPPVRKASDLVLPDAPREFVPGKAAPLMPADLPALPVAEKVTPAKTTTGDPFSSSADPFSTLSTPAVDPAPTPRAQREALPEILPAGGVQKAGGFAAPPANQSEQPEIQQIAGEQLPASMPPLPPTGEVLPDIIPNSERAPVMPDLPPAAVTPNPATPVTATPGEVLPFPSSPNTPPTSLPAASSNPSVNPSLNNNAPVMPLDDLPRARSAPSPFTPQANPTAMPAVPANNSRSNTEVMPDLSLIPSPSAVTPTPAPQPVVPNQPAPNQLIGTAEFDANAPRGPQTPELKIEKIAPTEAEVGESVIYAIIIRNVGGSDAKDVIVEDRIPRGAQLEGTIPQAYLNDGKLSWQLGTIEPGGERKIQLKVVPIEAGQIGSVATVSFASAVSASIKVNAPKMTIDMTGPTEVVFGEPMNFQFTLRNLGQGVAKSVYLRAILPPGLKHPGGNDLEYESGTMAPGSEKIIDLSIMAEHEGVYTINAQVTNDGKTHADTRADVSVIKSRLELTRTGPENRFVGRAASVILKIANTSSELLQGITVQEKLAPGIELAALPGGGRWDPKTRLITWKLDQLKAGEAREISVLYVANSAGDHIGRLVAADEAGNQCALETNLNAKGFSELTPDYKVDQRTVLVNERVTLQMVLKNDGTAPSRNVRTQFILPDGVEFVSARGPVEYQMNGNQVVFLPLSELAVGAEETFHLAVLAKQPGTAKITLKLEADDYAEPVFQDQAFRVIAGGS